MSISGRQAIRLVVFAAAISRLVLESIRSLGLSLGRGSLARQQRPLQDLFSSTPSHPRFFPSQALLSPLSRFFLSQSLLRTLLQSFR
jgi:hypothetical protein